MNKIQKIAILSISLLSIMASAAISPSLSEIQNHFEIELLLTQMVISLPAIFIIPTALITGLLIFKYHKKHILVVGLSLYLIGGLSGALANNIYVLLVFRGIMGIGVGLLLPLATSIIADFFTGNERSKMMGYSFSYKNLGGIIATIGAGVLGTISWRYPFLVYILGFVVLLLVVLYLPKQEIPEKPKRRGIVSKNIWLLGISHFMMIQIMFAMPSTLSAYVRDTGIGTPSQVGIFLTMLSLGSFVFGIFFHRIKTALKGFTVTIGLILMSVGVLAIGLTDSIIVLLPALFVAGAGIGLVAPNIYLQTSLDSNPLDVTLSLAIVSCFSFFGQFASPIIINVIQNITNYQTTESPFIISFYIGILCIIAVLINKKIKVYRPKKQSYYKMTHLVDTK